MEVLVKIPKECEKYFEYIPEDLLPSVFSSCVIAGMEQKLHKREDEDKVINKEMFMTLLQQVQGAGILESLPSNSEVSEKPAPVSNDNIIKPVLTKVDVKTDVDDDFIDFIGDFIK